MKSGFSFFPVIHEKIPPTHIHWMGNTHYSQFHYLNHDTCKEVTWCLTSCYGEWVSTILWLWWKILKPWEASEYLFFHLCFKVQFSVLRKSFDQLIQMGKMVCSTDLLISYPLEGSLKLPNSISLAHTFGNTPLQKNTFKCKATVT